MAWAAIDDKMPHHPKVTALTDREFRAWVCAITYSQQYNTRGHIPRHALDSIPRASTKVAGRLVQVGLWDEHPDDGWVIHDFDDWNPDLSKRREQARERKRRQRASGGDVTPTNGVTALRDVTRDIGVTNA